MMTGRGVLVVVLIAAVIGAAAGAGTMAKAIYTMTNSPSGNAVIAVCVDSSTGALKSNTATTTPTGGRGGTITNGGKVPAADPIASQGSVAVGTTGTGNALTNWVFVVNAGSNTVSALKVGPNPNNLTLVKTVSSGGSFPISLAFSASLQAVAVLNAGNDGTVQLFHVDGSAGLIPYGSQKRSLNLNNSAIPSNGPFGTPAQVVFTPNSAALVVSVKGYPAMNKTGYLAVFLIANKKLATDPVLATFPIGALYFGIAWASKTVAVIADPGVAGAVTVSINGNNGATSEIGYANLTGTAKAPCWSAYASSSGLAYITDGGDGVISAITPKTGKLAFQYTVTPAVANLLDSVAYGTCLYSIASVNGSIVVSDLSMPSMIMPMQMMSIPGITNMTNGIAAM